MKRPRANQKIRAALLAGAMLLAAAPQTALAQARPYNIPSQPLADALREWGRTSGNHLLFTEDLVRGKVAPAVSGTLDPDEALSRLLRGSGLRAQRSANGSIMIRAVGREAPPPGETEAGGAAANEAGASSSEGVAEILVIGRRSLNADIRRSESDARPYVVFERAMIERSGAQNLEEFFRNNLTASSTGEANVQTNSSLGPASRIDLGGLGTDETLILVDGRRLANLNSRGSINQPDINAIPVGAVERIEVLRSSASGIYGGGATGGVINVVLRRDYEGVDVTLLHGGTYDGGASRQRIDLTGGLSFGGGATSIMASLTLSQSDALLVGDRDLLQRGRARILANSPATFYGTPAAILLGATTNVSNATGAALTFKPSFGGAALGSSRTFVPVGYAGPASDNGAGLIANAGNYNFDLADTSQPTGARRPLLQEPRLASASATLRHRFSNDVSLFAEVSASENRSTLALSASPIGFTLLGTAAGNPFAQNVVVTVPILGVNQELTSQIGSRRAAAGITARLFGDWSGSVEGIWQRLTIENGPTDYFFTSSATAAISSGAINVFDDRPDDLAFVPFIFDDLVPGYRIETTFTELSGRIAGPVPFEVFGQRPTLNASLAHRQEKVGDSILTSPGASPTALIRTLFPEADQDVDSVYGELLVPLGRRANRNLLELQVSARYDNYRATAARSVSVAASLQPTAPVVFRTVHWQSLDPSVALRFRPLPDLMLRASYGTGFLPPTPSQFVPAAQPGQLTAATFNAFGVRDPLRGDEVVGTAGPVIVDTSGNPDLEPESSESWSAGIVLTPRFLPALRLSADWSRIDKTNAITVLPLATPGLLPLLIAVAPERITRGTATTGVGPITALNLSPLNFARARVEAIEFALDWRLPTERLGSFALRARATHYITSRLQATPGGAIVDNAGVLNTTAGTLSWRAVGTLEWMLGGFTAAWTVRFYDSYFLNPAHTFVAAQGSATVPSQTYHDLFVSYEFARGPMRGFGIRGGVTNLFDRRPPFDSQSITNAFYSSVGDPRGATWYVSLRKSFGTN